VPDDGARDVPDISMGADGGAPGFFVYSREEGTHVASLVATGGTSIASPMWAAISRLVAQSQGVTRLGNINPRLYELGNLQSPTSGLHDITSGNNDDGAILGYGAALGYDQVTGWGDSEHCFASGSISWCSTKHQGDLSKACNGRVRRDRCFLARQYDH
jgi:subtilase family serine protease